METRLVAYQNLFLGFDQDDSRPAPPTPHPRASPPEFVSGSTKLNYNNFLWIVKIISFIFVPYYGTCSQVMYTFE